MNAMILLTAMSATGGIFGGHKARTHPYYRTAPTTACATGTCPRVQAAAPVTYAPAPVAAPAPTYTYQSYYSVGTACATGNCPKR